MESRQSSSPSTAERGRGGRPADLDEVDRAIVEELRRDGRLSVRALAERVHISRAGAYNRLERLHDEGVITGYTALVDADKLGLTTAAYVSVSIEQGSWREVVAALQTLPGVQKVSLVGAEFDMLVEVRAHDNHELRDVVLEQIQAVPGVRGTRTWLVFESWESPA